MHAAAQTKRHLNADQWPAIEAFGFDHEHLGQLSIMAVDKHQITLMPGDPRRDVLAGTTQIKTPAVGG